VSVRRRRAACLQQRKRRDHKVSHYWMIPRDYGELGRVDRLSATSAQS